MVHPSAASPKRPAGTIISSPKGWYDAGDYNKYIVNSGFTLGLILQSYQLHQDRFNSLNLQIPESDNKIPDILDEMMYNLEWMLTMQDPTDGGVYHKLTTPKTSFSGLLQNYTSQPLRHPTWNRQNSLFQMNSAFHPGVTWQVWASSNG